MKATSLPSASGCDRSMPVAAQPRSANHSTSLRRGLTLCFGRPFMKPQMDWPRFLPDAAHDGLTPVGRQLLGFHARIPSSVEDYYRPPDQWAFKADQI